MNEKVVVSFAEYVSFLEACKKPHAEPNTKLRELLTHSPPWDMKLSAEHPFATVLPNGDIVNLS